MSFRGPSIIKLNGGLGQQAPSDRNVAGLIFANGYELVGQFEFSNVYVFNSLDEAEALGLSRASDANAAASDGTSAMCWYHISEFFLLNPDGKLYVYNGMAVVPGDIFDEAGAADTLMAASSNGIRFVGVVFGFDPAAVVAITAGFQTGVSAARTAAQAWVVAKAEAFVFIDTVVIEGYAMSETLVDLKATDAPGVVIVVANDQDYMTNFGGAPGLVRTGAVGTALGSIGVRMLSESIGSIVIERLPSEARGRANYSLVNARQGRWLVPALTFAATFDSLSQAVRDELTAKAYLYVGRIEGYEGVYFNADATCTTITDDFNTIHTNRVWNESARRVRRALVPRINSRVQIVPETGKIKASTIADWDAAARRELEGLLAEGEIADFRFTMDPNQDVIAQGKVVVRIAIVPQGIAKFIEAEIGFSNPAQA